LTMSKWRDQIQILKHFPLQRMLNLSHLGMTFLFQKWLKNGKAKALPFSLSIEPTTACNLGCPECPSGLKRFTRPTGKLSHQLHEKILDEVKSHVAYINYYFQGEPFLHPDFLELIRAAKKRRIYTATSTNAHFIDERKAEEIVRSGLDRLIISIDGLSQKSYEQYRVNGSLEKVLEATKLLVFAKSKLKSHTPHLIFQFLAVAPNEEDIPQLFDKAKELKIDEVRIKTAQLYDFENGNPLMPKNEKYSRYKLGSDGKYHLKNQMKNECWRMWSGSVITWDGKAVPCCFDKDAFHQLGDLHVNSFKEIWQSNAYIDFRKKVFGNRQSVDICKNCTEGTKAYS
jgi:radical SAM protein with 4Fe4S-binding SPASM domain